MVYYNVRVQITSASGKDTWSKVQESSKHKATNCHLPVESWTALLFPAITSDNIPGVLPVREGHLSLSIQSYYWDSIT